MTPTVDGHGVRLANESWEALLSAQVSVMRGFAAERMWDEMSINEYDVLYALKKAGCALRQSELTKQVLLSQPALSRLVERLEQRGLVQRSVDDRDRRGVLVSLTDAGADAQQRTGARHARSVEERMRTLTPEQQQQLRDLCTLLITDDRSRGSGPALVQEYAPEAPDPLIHETTPARKHS